jgi:hypothetical protein
LDDDTPPTHAPSGEAPPPVEPGATAFLTMGLAAAVSLVVGFVGGALLDGWLGTSPALSLVGLGVGVVGAVLIVVTRVRTYL